MTERLGIVIEASLEKGAEVRLDIEGAAGNPRAACRCTA